MLSGGLSFLQHASLALLKEMFFTLDLAYQVGNALDRKASDRLQRRSASNPTFLSSVSQEGFRPMQMLCHAQAAPR